MAFTAFLKAPTRQLDGDTPMWFAAWQRMASFARRGSGYRGIPRRSLSGTQLSVRFPVFIGDVIGIIHNHQQATKQNPMALAMRVFLALAAASAASACTTLVAGRKATADGSVVCSHSDDGNGR